MINRLVDNVRYLCRVNNESIGKLEKKLGVCVGYFSRVKNYTCVPSAELLYKLSSHFKVTMDDLWTRPLYKEQRIKELKEELEKLENEVY